jgi:hypothetical protein
LQLEQRNRLAAFLEFLFLELLHRGGVIIIGGVCLGYFLLFDLALQDLPQNAFEGCQGVKIEFDHVYGGRAMKQIFELFLIDGLIDGLKGVP